MTNAQLAHKMGIDKVGHPGWEYGEALVRAGLTVVAQEVTVLNLTCIEAEMQTPCGVLHVYCGTNGTARIDKPNGTRKWVYEKTPAQIAAQLNQVAAFYRY